MFKKILIATDGSNPAFAALDVAVDMASKYDARLIILHVLMHGKVPQGFKRMTEIEHISNQHRRAEELFNMPGNLMTMMEKIDPDVAEDEYFDLVGKQIIENSTARAKKSGVDLIESKMETGDVAETILNTIAEDQVDLVILGTRGIGPVARLLMGSVATKVVQFAECPCLTVK